MRSDYWRTYSGSQAGQIISALQYLLDGNVLDGEGEENMARSIQVRLRNASMGGESVTMVPFNKEEDELISQVEATLWR